MRILARRVGLGWLMCACSLAGGLTPHGVLAADKGRFASAAWPGKPESLSFAWADFTSAIHVPATVEGGPERIGFVQPHGWSWYGPANEMVLANGGFSIDPPSAQALSAGCRKTGRFSLELLMVPDTAQAGADTRVLTLAGAEGGVDPDNAVWLLRMKGLIVGPGQTAENARDLWIRIVRQEGKFAGGIGSTDPRDVAKAFNRAVHAVDASALRFSDGALSGEILVTVNPDPWLPPDNRSWRGLVSLEAKTEAGKYGQKDGIRGKFTGDSGGAKTEGALAGECLKQERRDMEDFSTRLSVHNGWINDYLRWASAWHWV